MAPPPLFQNILGKFGLRSEQTSYEKELPATKPPTRIVTDEDLLQVIDEVYLKAKDMLLKGRYNKVLEALLFYNDYDICFRRILSSQLTHDDFLTNGEKVYLAEEIMNFIVIIQSYFNSFRVNLLSDVIRDLNAAYNEVLDLLPISFQQATVRFNNTNAINMFLINRIKDWHYSMPWDERDEISERMFEETVEAFKELRLNATHHLQRIISEQLSKL